MDESLVTLLGVVQNILIFGLGVAVGLLFDVPKP